MADSVLSKLVQTDKDTKKSLDSMDSTLQRIYKLEVKNTKSEETSRKRSERDAKRKKADFGLKGLIDALKKQAAVKKKEEKKAGGIGNTLKQMLAFMTGGALAKLLSGLAGGAGGLIKGGGKLIFGGAKGLFGMLGNLSKGLSGLLGKGGKGLAGLLGKGGKGLGKMIKGGGILAALTSGIMEFFNTKSITDALFAGGGAGAGAIAGGALGSLLGPIGTAVGAALGGFIGDQLGKIFKDQLDKNPFLAKVFGKLDEMFNNMLKDIMKYVDAVKKTFGQFMYMIEQFGRAFNKFNKDIIQPFFKSVGNFFKGAWDKFTGGVQWVANFLDKTFGPYLKKIGEFLAPILDPLKELATNILTPVVDGFKALLDFLNPIKAATKLMEGAGNVFENIGDFFKNYADKKQQGGFVGTVPNQGGNGDRFASMLSPGSVVLNQNASRYMQNGGMVPTMLEQGEKVFGPNDPGAGAALAMNSMIPRFQSGGVVEGNHSETGPGWSVGTDAQGRPAIFSKGGAESFSKMMKASDGAVNPKDINSAQRSPSKNSSVGGATNSNHLYGNGVDVQTGSSSWNWMRSNSGKYGWNWNDYLGPSGWHWDYTGKNSGTSVPQGNESGIKQDNKQGLSGAIGAALKGLGGAGGFVTSALGALTEGLGSGLSSALGLGGLSSITNALGGGAQAIGGAITGAISGSSTSNGSLSNNEKAVLNALADAEGTTKYGNNGYNTQFTGKQFTGKKHPRQVINSGRYGSDAAGRYQFLSTTWDEYANGRDMSPSNQDAVALDLISKKRRVDMSDGLSKREVYRLGQEWASVEGGPSGTKGGSYGGQAKYSAEQFMAMYTKYGGKIQGKQTGGVVNMSGTTSSGNSRYQKAQEQFASQIAAASSPIVIPVPSGSSSGARPSVNSIGTPAPPSLPDGPSSIQSAEYFYRLNMGTAF